ncbi:MAG: CxxC-x17-CxxC domain-containing protein [Clostridia bacterium]
MLNSKEAKVPFQPSDDRPVYCSECYASMKQN